MLTIKVYGSKCTTTEFYKNLFEELLQKEKIGATFEIVEDVDEINELGLDIGCMFGYCPGCNTAHEDKKQNERYVPALVVNGDIIFHSYIPNEDQIQKIIKRLRAYS